jgi:surface antigen
MSTIEMLATSKDLSDYLDKQQYSEAVQNKIQDTLNQIIDLQNKLRSQKNEVDQLLQTQQDQQSQLDSDRAQKDHLLSMNQNQQSEYNQQIKHNQKKINQLEAEQAAINAASSRTVAGGFAIPGASNGHGGACDIGHGNGGYPMVWCNADQDSLTTSGGFPNRECTSFAYWYFTSVEGKSLYVTGNAKDWYYTSNRPVTGTPHVGDIFVHTAGPYGHVGIVVGISGGYVQTISMNDDYYGHFYNTREYPISELYYIH